VQRVRSALSGWGDQLPLGGRDEKNHEGIAEREIRRMSGESEGWREFLFNPHLSHPLLLYGLR
jgi:hypothetical protein